MSEKGCMVTTKWTKVMLFRARIDARQLSKKFQASQEAESREIADLKLQLAQSTEREEALAEQIQDSIPKWQARELERRLFEAERLLAQHLGRPQAEEVLKEAVNGSLARELIFDGHAVYQQLDQVSRMRTSPENVSDVLDALNRAIQCSPAKREALKP